MRGPYGTNEGDKWLAEGSPMQERLDAEDAAKPSDGQRRERRVLIHEMMVKDGELQPAMYVTSNAELIAEATEGHEKWVAAQAVNN